MSTSNNVVPSPGRRKKILPTVRPQLDKLTVPEVRAEFVSPTWSKILSEELKQRNLCSKDDSGTPPCRAIDSSSIRDTGNRKTKSKPKTDIVQSRHVDEIQSDKTDSLSTDAVVSRATYHPDNDRITKFDREIAAVFGHDDLSDASHFEESETDDMTSLTSQTPLLSRDFPHSSAELDNRNNHSFRDHTPTPAKELNNSLKSKYNISNDETYNSNIINDNSYNNNNSNNNNSNTINDNINIKNSSINNNNNNSSPNIKSNDNGINSKQKNKFLHLTDIVRSMSKSPSGTRKGNPIELDATESD